MKFNVALKTLCSQKLIIKITNTKKTKNNKMKKYATMFLCNGIGNYENLFYSL